MRHVNEVLDSVFSDGRFGGMTTENEKEIIQRLDDFVVNSEPSLRVFLGLVESAWRTHKWLTFSKPRIGEQRSLDQNALFHIWAREYAAHLLKKNPHHIKEGELDGMKRVLKSHCYRDNAWDFLIYEKINPFTGESKKDYRSTKHYKTGEMYLFLTWMQMKAATDGLVLESKGEFKHNQQKQNS